MKRTAFGLFTVLLIATAAVSVNAQSIVCPLKVTIPFDFFVGDTVLHHGDYTVSTLNADGILVLRGAHDSLTVLTTPSETRGDKNAADKLIFHHVNGEYFLVSVWTADNSVGYGLFKSRREREHVAAGAKPESKVLIANTN